jgi:hypothetical protein
MFLHIFDCGFFVIIYKETFDGNIMKFFIPVRDLNMSPYYIAPNKYLLASIAYVGLFYILFVEDYIPILHKIVSATCLRMKLTPRRQLLSRLLECVHK